MNLKSIIALIVPGFILGVLVTIGILKSLFLIAVFWTIILLAYPFLISAIVPENPLGYTLFILFFCGSCMVWIPVQEYQTFIAFNPEKMQWLNQQNAHPRRYLLFIGESIVFWSSLAADMLEEVFLIMADIWQKIPRKHHE